jgi:hypothetical protein
MNSDSLGSLTGRRDTLIVQLWNVFRDMSDTQEPEDFTTEDLDLWGVVTSHSAIQNKLPTKEKKQ